MKKEIKEKLIDILTEGFACQPFKNWDLDATATAEEKREAQRLNEEHIEGLTKQILKLFQAQREEIKQIVIEDVPHQYQERLLDNLNQL